MTPALATAVDLTWHRRDRGGKLLVVERGAGWDPETGAHYYSNAGVIIGTAETMRGARIIAGRRIRYHRARGLAGRVDIVPRDSVAVSKSREPYGCFSGG